MLRTSTEGSKRIVLALALILIEKAPGADFAAVGLAIDHDGDSRDPQLRVDADHQRDRAVLADLLDDDGTAEPALARERRRNLVARLPNRRLEVSEPPRDLLAELGRRGDLSPHEAIGVGEDGARPFVAGQVDLVGEGKGGGAACQRRRHQQDSRSRMPHRRGARALCHLRYRDSS